jgi:hypothetical protein
LPYLAHFFCHFPTSPAKLCAPSLTPSARAYGVGRSYVASDRSYAEAMYAGIFSAVLPFLSFRLLAIDPFFYIYRSFVTIIEHNLV